jgi:hypothetical protein
VVSGWISASTAMSTTEEKPLRALFKVCQFDEAIEVMTRAGL